MAEGFKLASAFVEITGDKTSSDRAIDATRRKLGALPASTTVAIRGDASAFAAVVAAAKAKLAGLAQAAANFSFGGALKGAAGTAVGMAGGAALGQAASLGTAAIGGAIEGASHLAEAQSKVDVVFGKSAASVHGFAAAMAETYGSSRNEVYDAAAGFGLIGKAAGMSRAEAAKLAVTFAQLADDATSFYDVPLEEALRTLKSALVGEIEPIRRWGVLLGETETKNEALRMGLVSTRRELTQQEKVAVRISMIQKGLADATGDHARTAGSFANSWREFKGRVADFGQTLGSAVLPVLNVFLRVLNPIAQVLQAIAETVRDATAGITRFAGAVNQAMFGGRWGGDLLGGGSAPGMGAAAAMKVATEEGAAGGAAAPPGKAPKFGIEAARKSVAEDEVQAQQDRFVQQARDEAAAKKRRAMVARSEQAMARFRIGNESFADLIRSPKADAYARKHGAESMRRLAEFEADKDARGRKDAPVRDEDRAGAKAARDFLDKAGSVAKEKLGQAFAFKDALKVAGLNVAARGLEYLDAKGAPARKEREERELGDFHSEKLSSASLADRLQSAALSRTDRKEQVEMARNTAQTVIALTNGFRELNATLKQLRGVAVFQ